MYGQYPLGSISTALFIFGIKCKMRNLVNVGVKMIFRFWKIACFLQSLLVISKMWNLVKTSFKGGFWKIVKFQISRKSRVFKIVVHGCFWKIDFLTCSSNLCFCFIKNLKKTMNFCLFYSKCIIFYFFLFFCNISMFYK